MPAYAALLRGVNVGGAKRVPMADLRELMEGLGHTDVRTLLNSGNAVFKARGKDPGRLAKALAAAIESRFGFSVAVVVVGADELDAIVKENPLSKMARDPSRYLVGFFTDPPAALAAVRPLVATAWAPEALALGSRAAYLWCADGIADSKLVLAFMRATKETATARNWATVLKLQAMLA